MNLWIRTVARGNAAKHRERAAEEGEYRWSAAVMPRLQPTTGHRMMEAGKEPARMSKRDVLSIKDIARSAHVSHSTVSRALRNSPLVNADTGAVSRN